MNTKQKQILAAFLKDYPEYHKAEWDGEFTVYFAHKPNEPFTATEFVEGSSTKRLLTQIGLLLEEASDTPN